MRSLTRRVVSGEWSYVRRDPRQPPGADKPGLLSLVAPSVLDLHVGATPTGAVALGFLKSYDERMGELEVRCHIGCACNTTTLHGWHNRRSSVLAFGVVGTSAVSDDCVLRLTHRARSVATGKGRGRAAGSPAADAAAESKFKLAAVVVPPFVIDPGDHDVVTARGLNLS